jgi:hypothetical protein
MAEPLSLNVPRGPIVLGTTLTQLTGDTSSGVYLTITEASADIRVALGPGLSDGGAAPVASVLVKASNLPYSVWVNPHGAVYLFATSGTPTCTVLLEGP